MLPGLFGNISRRKPACAQREKPHYPLWGLVRNQYKNRIGLAPHILRRLRFQIIVETFYSAEETGPLMLLAQWSNSVKLFGPVKLFGRWLH
jgi:hypothetical protein